MKAVAYLLTPLQLIGLRAIQAWWVRALTLHAFLPFVAPNVHSLLDGY